MGENHRKDGDRLLQILVDADACPVVKIVERIAKKYNISLDTLVNGKNTKEKILTLLCS